MNPSSLRYLIDNALDFCYAAKHVEDEIIRLNLDSNRRDEVPNLGGRTHHDTWASKKNVSHSNLGTSLELMLKLVLYIEGTEYENKHSLIYLHDLVSKRRRDQLDSSFKSALGKSKGLEFVAFTNEIRLNRLTGSTPSGHTFVGPPGTAPIAPKITQQKCLRECLEYFDEDARLFERRYQWEYIARGQSRHYVKDLTVFIDFVQDVLNDINSSIKTSHRQSDL